jgi:hypothetical protein
MAVAETLELAGVIACSESELRNVDGRTAIIFNTRRALGAMTLRFVVQPWLAQRLAVHAHGRYAWIGNLFGAKTPAP